jgi:hypothetical protein
MDVDLAVEAQTSDVTYVHALLVVCIHLFRLKFNGWSSRVGNVKLLSFILSKAVLITTETDVALCYSFPSTAG